MPSALASVRTPAVEKLEVAVSPKYAGPVAERSVVEAREKVASPVKVFAPEKVLASVRIVEEAAEIVMFAVPSKETPLMVRAVARAVAVPTLREEVATCRNAVPALSVYIKRFPVRLESPVPPLEMPSALASVR